MQSAQCRVQSADCTITLLHFGVVEHSAELSIMLGIMQTSLSLSFEQSGPITLFSSLDALMSLCCIQHALPLVRTSSCDINTNVSRISGRVSSCTDET